MTRHASAEALARLREGHLSAHRSARIEAHLACCARCRAASDGLAEVQALLASTQAPPVPHHLAARIENALAAEASRRAAGGGRQQPAREAIGGRGTERPLRAWPPRPAALRVLAAAAAVAAVAGGYEIVSHAARPATFGASATAGAPAARHAAGPAAGAARSSAMAPSGPVLQYRLGGRPMSFTPLATGADFRPGNLAAQVRALVAQGLSRPVPAPLYRSASPGDTAAGASAEGQLHSVPVTALEACVTRVSAGRRVVLVDQARYRGQPATVIVTAAGPAADQIWVVGPACSGSRSDVLAHQPLAAP